MAGQRRLELAVKTSLRQIGGNLSSCISPSPCSLDAKCAARDEETVILNVLFLKAQKWEMGNILEVIIVLESMRDGRA